jgi:hypothetical protein
MERLLGTNPDKRRVELNGQEYVLVTMPDGEEIPLSQTEIEELEHLESDIRNERLQTLAETPLARKTGMSAG